MRALVTCPLRGVLTGELILTYLPVYTDLTTLTDAQLFVAHGLYFCEEDM